ncbi:S-adenosylmethionine-diacylglycerol 3-amino-3-carboxypropyl transferase [Asanoa ishikariensis]|uniref:S-adenosylmethionine-diacylglycerol 3-amino-3-carboxypropyl transferase n=1 Tax=Asanoa ishikariensis TaxID=137265 RepID=A0A1H3UDC8_9ACTN|nr:S-adenosylmethionine-diacylglycerol 3-amino-3-carboxypropyl transferase [Asanoa ishikariensis]
MPHLADRAFAATFKHVFTFSLLYEDSEVDNRVLELDPRSRVLAVSGAGCGVAGLLAAHPARIDAVDTNPHHLALAALKVAAARRMTSHGEFYQLLGRGRHTDPARALQPLMTVLPAWIGRYWRAHHRRFRDNLYAEGLVGTFQRLLRQKVGVDADFLRTVQALPPAERLARFEPIFASLRRWWPMRALVNTPLFLLGVGVNFEQRRRNLRASRSESMMNVVTAQFERLVRTDLETNWFVWLCLTGEFNHDHPDAVPPYLREQSHKLSLVAPTRVGFHRASLQELLADGTPGQWSHFSLCDVLDWMPAPAQHRLLHRIARVGGPGAVVLTRSVEDACVVDRVGLSDRFERVEPTSTLASELERTRLYGRVNVYRVVSGA